MGGVAKAVGSVIGGVTGGITGGLMDAGGITNTYQASGPQIQPELLAQIKQAYGAQDPIQQQQNALAQALLAQSQGQGVNPAQLMMKQATERANMQRAGMLGSARGVNPALAARMAGQGAMANQQAAAQQAGILGAQQQVQAQQALGGLYGQMGQQNLNQQQILQNAFAGQQGQAMQGQQINAGVAAGNTQARTQLAGGLLQAAGGIGAKMFGAAHGAIVPGVAAVDGDHSANDTVPAMLSPGEIVIPRSKAKDPDLAKEFIDHLMAKEGKKKKKGA